MAKRSNEQIVNDYNAAYAEYKTGSSWNSACEMYDTNRHLPALDLRSSRLSVQKQYYLLCGLSYIFNVIHRHNSMNSIAIIKWLSNMLRNFANPVEAEDNEPADCPAMPSAPLTAEEHKDAIRLHILELSKFGVKVECSEVVTKRIPL